MRTIFVWWPETNSPFYFLLKYIIARLEWYPILWRYYILLSHSSVDGHLDWFYFLAILSTATINVHMQVSTWIYGFIYLDCTPKSGIAGSCGNFLVSILGNCQTVFCCSVLYSHHYFANKWGWIRSDKVWCYQIGFSIII